MGERHVLNMFVLQAVDMWSLPKQQGKRDEHSGQVLWAFILAYTF